MGKLKPGAMGKMDLPDTPPSNKMPEEFAGSMAAAIEAAFNTILKAEDKNTIEVNTNSREARDRRMMFVAIAQGIINHLTANEDAFVVNPGDHKLDIQTK